MNSILKKTITAVSGLLLVGFLVTHLAANLTLLTPDGYYFNSYVQRLHSFGPLLVVAEVGLAALFLFHIVNGILLVRDHYMARPKRYRAWKSKGGPSYAGLSSLGMAVSGFLLLVFLVIHIGGLRFGPGEAEGYITEINGGTTRDLYRLVVEQFSRLWVVVVYVIATLAIGLHLRHGLWSAFQSLGVSRPSFHRVLRPLALVVAVIFSVGFLILPVVLYLRSLN